MASIIKVDALQEKTSGNGIFLENSLKDSTGTNEIISPSGGITIPSGQSIKNSSGTSLIDASGTMSSDMVFPAGHIIQVVGHNVGGSAAAEISWTDGSQQTVISETITIQENSRIKISFVIPISNASVDTSAWSSMAWFDIYLNGIPVQRLEHTGDYIVASGNTHSVWNQPGSYITSNLSAGTYTFDIKVDPYQANSFQVFRNPYAGTITLYEIAG